MTATNGKRLDQFGLHLLLSRSAQRFPDRVAVSDPTSRRAITYRELDELSDRLRDRLVRLGVEPGDRVGLCLRKSIDAVVSIFGALKAGAAYVPSDPTAPAARNAFVLGDCSAAALIVEQRYTKALRNEWKHTPPPMLILDGETNETNESPLRHFLDRADRDEPAPKTATFIPAQDHPAYILYTSGSTGKPKGVVMSHENATSFLTWCSETFRPDEHDRFSSHAPFHFDLSILDLFLPIKHGAFVSLIGEEISKNPPAVVALLVEEKLTIWYSTPSVLTLLIEYGKLAARDDVSLRYVLFAGEVFPVKHLHHLKQALPKPRFFNLYGPTETNVCTYYEIPATIPEERVKPYPIGEVCSHLEARVIDTEDRQVHVGERGQLIIRGRSVMQGYWRLPDRTTAAYLKDESGRWYRTGDLVVESQDGIYTFLGRSDRMVKRRGFRIELGEIEAALHKHTEISEAAAVAFAGPEGVTIKAFYSTRESKALSVITLKRFCAEHLPAGMIPDRFRHLERFPKTSTHKIDYQHLKETG